MTIERVRVSKVGLESSLGMVRGKVAVGHVVISAELGEIAFVDVAGHLAQTGEVSAGINTSQVVDVAVPFSCLILVVSDSIHFVQIRNVRNFVNSGRGNVKSLKVGGVQTWIGEHSEKMGIVTKVQLNQFKQRVALVSLDEILPCLTPVSHKLVV